MTTLKPKLNKWQLVIMFHRDYMRMALGWNTFSFGVLKIIKLPENGERLQKKHYKGFYISLLVWLPIAKD